MTDETCPTTGTILDWVRDPSNRSAWETFAVRYRAKIKSWCLRNGLQEPEAEDVSQGILLLICDKIKSYDQEKGRFRHWLKTITYHSCIDFFRQEKTRRFQALLDNIPAREDLERELDGQARTEALRVALEEVQAGVTPRDWEIFEAMTFKKQPTAELARKHGITKAAVHQAKYRVQEKVKARALELGEAGDDMDLPDE
jgi:RNA polymerase sigma factor (sigma-70 family)